VRHGPEAQKSGALLEPCDAARQGRKSSETLRVGEEAAAEYETKPKTMIKPRALSRGVSPVQGSNSVGRQRSWGSRPRLYSGAPCGAQIDTVHAGSRVTPKFLGNAPPGFTLAPLAGLSRSRHGCTSGYHPRHPRGLEQCISHGIETVCETNPLLRSFEPKTLRLRVFRQIATEVSRWIQRDSA
jgi:hypothetical protein